MKKVNKKLVVATAACAALLVGSISTSLAWLVDKTGDVTNTFTDSDINIKLEETTGNNYKMIPGWTIPKDPKVTVADDSEDCYVFVKVTEDLGSWTDNIINENGADSPATFDDYLHYDMAEGWIQGVACTCEDGTHIETSECKYNGVPTDVYYRIVNDDSDKEFYVLKGAVCNVEHSDSDEVNCVNCANANGYITVDGCVTKGMMDEVDGKDAQGAAVDSEKKPTLTFTAAAVQYYSSNGVAFNVEEAYALVGWSAT